MVVSDEIQFWKLADQSLEANLCPVLPVRCMCMTGDFISFFMSQDTHIEKWVIDWRIVHEGKKYYPPLSQYVSHDTGLEKSEVSAPKNDYKGHRGDGEGGGRGGRGVVRFLLCAVCAIQAS